MPTPRHHPSREAIDELGLRFIVSRPWNSSTIIATHLAWHRSQRTDEGVCVHAEKERAIDLLLLPIQTNGLTDGEYMPLVEGGVECGTTMA
jgi:hypothetical protein